MPDKENQVLYQPTENRLRRMSRWHIPPREQHSKKRRIGYNAEEEWPGPSPCADGVSYVCWYDTYEFQGEPWGIVLERHKSGQRWHMHEGHFCSPECQKAFMLTMDFRAMHNRVRFYDTMMWNTIVRGLPSNTVVVAAPPRTFLKRFQPVEGFDIDEWRSQFKTTTTVRRAAHMVTTVELVEEWLFIKEDEREKQKRVLQQAERDRRMRTVRTDKVASRSEYKRRSTAAPARRGPRQSKLMRILSTPKGVHK